MFSALFFVITFTSILLFIFEYKQLHTKVLEWTAFERTFLHQLMHSKDVSSVMKMNLLLEMLVPSKILFVNQYSFVFYVLFIYSVFSMPGELLPTWVYIFIAFYYQEMLMGTLVFIFTLFSPYLKSTLDAFLYGADMRAHFLGHYGSIQAKAFVSFLLLIKAFPQHYNHERDISLQRAIEEYTHMEEEYIPIPSGIQRKIAYFLRAMEIRDNSFWHYAIDHANIMQAIKAIEAFFA